MICPKCGKENPDDAKYCLECGENIEDINNNEEESTPVKNVFAIVGFVCGIVTFACSLLWFGLVPVGIVFSAIGLHSNEESYKGKAKKGLIFSIIGTIISIIWLIGFIIIVALLAE